MRKIVFIEPKAPNIHIFSQFCLPRLGCFILGTIMKKRGWDVTVMIEELKKLDFDEIKSADLVGISTITSTAPRAYAIADKVRSEFGKPVIMGGPHVTFLTEEALGHADFVVRGEGERALMAFADAWEGDKDYSKVPNLSYVSNESTVHTPMEPWINELDEIPHADFSLMKNPFRSLASFITLPMQTSRGCPYNCSFCSVTGMFGKKYRFRSTENIIEDLRKYNHSKNIIFFYDDHFTFNRRRAKELLEAMIREKFKFKWSTQVRVDVARDLEMIKLLEKAGCQTLFIGLESVNPNSLKAMNKNQDLEEIVNAVKIFKKHKINIHGMFVYGFDEDNQQTIKETIRFAKKAQLSSYQFLILTPLPGSQFYDRMCAEKRIKFSDWSLYDAHHAVFEPAQLSISDLQWAQVNSHTKLYSILETSKRFFRGKLISVAIANYARKLNHSWKKKNKQFLSILDLLSKAKGATVSVDYKENVVLDEERRAG